MFFKINYYERKYKRKLKEFAKNCHHSENGQNSKRVLCKWQRKVSKIARDQYRKLSQQEMDKKENMEDIITKICLKKISENEKNTKRSFVMQK